MFGRLAGSQFENNYFTEMCSGSEAGSYLRLIDFVHHSTVGLKVIKKKKKLEGFGVEKPVALVVFHNQEVAPPLDARDRDRLGPITCVRFWRLGGQGWEATNKHIGFCITKHTTTRKALLGIWRLGFEVWCLW